MTQEAKIIHMETEKILFSCSLDKLEELYSYAKLLEENEIEFQIQIPNTSETLIDALGKSPEEIEKFRKSTQEELDDHSGVE